jgi:hypothetical protein
MSAMVVAERRKLIGPTLQSLGPDHWGGIGQIEEQQTDIGHRPASAQGSSFSLLEIGGTLARGTSTCRSPTFCKDLVDVLCRYPFIGTKQKLPDGLMLLLANFIPLPHRLKKLKPGGSRVIFCGVINSDGICGLNTIIMPIGDIMNAFALLHHNFRRGNPISRFSLNSIPRYSSNT